MSTLFRKVTASVAALSIVLSVVSPVTGVRAATDSAVDAANRLAADGIIADQSKNPTAYNLGSSITRREMLKVMMNLSSTEVSNTCEGKFADLKASDWGCKYAEAALKAGFIAANKNFRPNDLVSKSEALKMIMQAKGIAKKDGVEPWQKAYVEAAVEAGVLSAAFTDYTATAKRSMVVVAADAAQSASSDEGDDDLDIGGIIGGIDTGSTNGTGTTNTTTGTTSTGTTNTGSNVVVGTGDLEISLNPASSADGTQVPKAGTVRFAKVDFAAASSDVALNSVEVKKVGLGTVDSNTKVWFEKAGKRVSGKSSFTSEGNVVVSFAPAYVVKAGSTETLDLYVELSTTSGNDYQFTSGVVTTTAKNVKGAFTTPKLRTADYAVATVSGSTAGSAASYKASSDSIELGGFKLVANDTKAEQTDLTFQSVTLYLSGNANLTSLTDLQLMRNDVKVSTEASIDGKAVTFLVKDTIKEGATGTYYVKAKVNTVENQTDTYQFRLKNTSDINVVEAKTGFRATLDTTVNGAVYSVTGGELKFERDSATSLSASYAPGTSEVVLMKGTLTAKNAVKLEDVELTYTTGGSVVAASSLFNTVYLTIGSSVFSASAPTSGNKINFNGTVNVTGTVNVKVYATLKSNASLGTIKLNEMTLNSFTGDKEFVSNNETVTSSVGTISGVQVTVESSTLNVTRNDGLGNANLAAGSKSVTLYGLSLTSTKGNPINVTSATFAFTGTNASTSTGHLNNVYATLYVNGTAVSSKTIDASTVKFDGFTAKVSSSSAATIAVKADLSDSFASGTLQTTLSSLTAVDSSTSDDVTSYSKPTGATFTIASADATLASSDNNPKASLLEAGKNDYKLFAFKVTAKNDSIKLKDVTLTGTSLNAFSNFRLADVNNTVVANAASSTDTSVKFESIGSDKTAVAMDKSTTFYVIADANNNTNVSNVSVTLDSVKITSSNGSDKTVDANVISNTHAVAENVLVVAKDANANKSLSSSALVFTVTASGKDSVTLSGFTIDTTPVGYTSTGTVEIYKDTYSAGNKLNTTVSGNVVTIASAGNNTVDAGSTVKFIVVLNGAVKNSSANTISYEVKLSDIQTSTVSSLKAYNNAGAFPFVETINN